MANNELTRDAKITALIADIRAAKTLARRDDLFDQIIGVWESTPAQAEPSGALPGQWHTRTNDLSDAACMAAMKAEIVELRAYAKQAIEARILGQQGGGDAADAARYRFLVDQLPCAIADDMQCSISNIGPSIDEAIENLAESRARFLEQHKGGV